MIPKDLTLEVVPEKLGFRDRESPTSESASKNKELGAIFWQEVAAEIWPSSSEGWLASVLPKIQASLEDGMQSRLISQPRENGPAQAEYKVPKILKTTSGEQR